MEIPIIPSNLRGLHQEYNVYSHNAVTSSTKEPTNEPTNENGSPLVDEHFGLFLVLVASITTMILLLAKLIREYYWKKFGIDICHRIMPRAPTSQSQSGQIRHDRNVAEVLQRQLNEAERERFRESKRKERQLWYESFMKPFTYMVEQRDFFSILYEGDVEAPALEASTEEKKPPPRKMTFESTDDEEDESSEENGSIEDICEKCDEDVQLYIRLPIQASHKCHKGQRVVEAHCAICFSNYEPGEKVAWSGEEHCKHAFHYDCIMPWLSNGKKRCPVCRHWFVPGARIEDQKQDLLEEQEEQTRRQQQASSSSEIALSSL